MTSAQLAMLRRLHYHSADRGVLNRITLRGLLKRNWAVEFNGRIHLTDVGRTALGERWR